MPSYVVYTPGPDTCICKNGICGVADSKRCGLNHLEEKTIIVDMTNKLFINAQFVSQIIVNLVKKDKKIVLVNCGDQPKVDKYLEFYDDLEEAISSI